MFIQDIALSLNAKLIDKKCNSLSKSNKLNINNAIIH